MIDLRSDTVTVPTPAMRDAMRDAEVGDDVYGEDPSVRELEDTVARLLGKEAALLVPSGTMGNLLASLTHCPNGGELIGPGPAHVFNAEVAGSARIAGLAFKPVPQRRGELDLEAFAGAIAPRNLLSPGSALLWVEQPTRGYLVDSASMVALRVLADSHGLPLHMDGARIFNAAAAAGLSPAELVREADSVMCCMSKGLGAPVGSLLAGRREFVDRAREHRQMLGGGMRQAGIVAAGALYALRNHVERLAEDHACAAAIHQALRKIQGVLVDRDVVESNIFYIDVSPEIPVVDLVSRLAERQILVNGPRPGTRRIRLVTHLGVRHEHLSAIAEAFHYAVEETSGPFRADVRVESAS